MRCTRGRPLLNRGLSRWPGWFFGFKATSKSKRTRSESSVKPRTCAMRLALPRRTSRRTYLLARDFASRAEPSLSGSLREAECLNIAVSLKQHRPRCCYSGEPNEGTCSLPHTGGAAAAAGSPKSSRIAQYCREAGLGRACFPGG